MRTTENPARFSRNQMEQENGGQEDKARFDVTDKSRGVGL